MNTIHSSSLAFHRTGPRPDGPHIDSTQDKPIKIIPVSSEITRHRQQPASTPDSIRMVLAKQDMDRVDNDQLASSPHHARAINAYSETYRHSVYATIEQMISGIDLYA